MAELKGKIDQFTLTVGDFNVESGQEESDCSRTFLNNKSATFNTLESFNLVLNFKSTTN